MSVYQFRKANYIELNNFFEQVDWSFLNSTEDIELLVRQFYEIIFTGIDKCVPKKAIKSQKYPQWFDSHLRRLIARKNKLYTKYKRSGLPTDYDAYSDLRREVKFRTDLCYLMFVTNTEHLIPQNVKHFWSFVKNLKSDSNLPTVK